MGAHVQCPRCEQSYALSDEQALLYAGREFECAQCTLRFIVPPSASRPDAGGRGDLPRAQLTAAAVRSPAVYGLAGSWTPSPYEESAPSSRLAAASMICGIIGLLVPIIPSFLAIILGIWAVRKVYAGRAEGASLAAGGIAVGAAGLVLSTALFYQRIAPLILPPKTVVEVRCSDHFHKIENALTLHAARNQGAYPDDLATLVENNLLDPAELICPKTTDTKAVGQSREQIAQRIRRGGHSSYVYAGKGLTTKSPAECVLLYEKLTPHREEGITVLFVDGRVEKIGSVEGNKAMTRLSAGQNPPWSAQ